MLNAITRASLVLLVAALLAPAALALTPLPSQPTAIPATDDTALVLVSVPDMRTGEFPELHIGVFSGSGLSWYAYPNDPIGQWDPMGTDDIDYSWTTGWANWQTRTGATMEEPK
jgi:hypothetical protein